MTHQEGIEGRAQDHLREIIIHQKLIGITYQKDQKKKNGDKKIPKILIMKLN